MREKLGKDQLDIIDYTHSARARWPARVSMGQTIVDKLMNLSLELVHTQAPYMHGWDSMACAQDRRVLRMCLHELSVRNLLVALK